MSEFHDVAGYRQFCWRLSRVMQDEANCESDHGVPPIEGLPSSSSIVSGLRPLQGTSKRARMPWCSRH